MKLMDYCRKISGAHNYSQN